jgi:heptosyltransferase-1
LAGPLQRILVVRLGAMGDVIHALPAVARLRAQFPEIEIGWVVEERWVPLLSSAEAVHGERSPLKPLVDNVHVVNTRAWRKDMWSKETWREMRTALHGVREKKYQLAIDFQGAWKSGLISRLSGAPLRYGFSQTREGGARLFYTDKVERAGAHVIEQNLGLAARVNQKISSVATQNSGTGHSPVTTQAVPTQAVVREDASTQAPATSDLLPRDPAVETWCDHALRTRGLPPGAFAIINPGAGWGAKCWPVEKYSDVARDLAARGLRSVVNFGPAEEDLARSLEFLSGGAATAISCSIGELIAITRRARLFVGGDTGPMHMAAALRVPVVGIFGPTDPARNGPWGTESVVLRRARSVTNHSRRAGPDEAMLSIGVEEVLSAALQLLERTATNFDGPPGVTRG